jgi:hypothetical protein
MSYQTIDALSNSQDFNARNRAAATEQAEVFHNDARPDFVATAREVLRGSAEVTLTFTRIAAASPGIADKASVGDGTVDQSKVTDADLLSLTQANWQVVAGLYFDTEGNRLPGTGGPTI